MNERRLIRSENGVSLTEVYLRAQGVPTMKTYSVLNKQTRVAKQASSLADAERLYIEELERNRANAAAPMALRR